MIQPNPPIQLPMRPLQQRPKPRAPGLRRAVIHTRPADLSVGQQLRLAEGDGERGRDAVFVGLGGEEVVFGEDAGEVGCPSGGGGGLGMYR